MELTDGRVEEGVGEEPSHTTARKTDPQSSLKPIQSSLSRREDTLGGGGGGGKLTDSDSSYADPDPKVKQQQKIRNRPRFLSHIGHRQLLIRQTNLQNKFIIHQFTLLKCTFLTYESETTP